MSKNIVTIALIAGAGFVAWKFWQKRQRDAGFAEGVGYRAGPTPSEVNNNAAAGLGTRVTTSNDVKREAIIQGAGVVKSVIDAVKTYKPSDNTTKESVKRNASMYDAVL